jgi:hypothetical protein
MPNLRIPPMRGLPGAGDCIVGAAAGRASEPKNDKINAAKNNPRPIFKQFQFFIALRPPVLS